MEGWCVGVIVAWSHHSCTMGGHADTHRDTYKWAKYVCEASLSSLQEKCVFVSFSFSGTGGPTLTEHSLAPRLSCFFMHMYPLSSQIDPDIYELGLTCILLLSLLLLCISGEGNNIRPGRGGAEAEAITAPIIRLVWFMIYADHIWPKITPLEALGCKKLF